ncbi:hypothetical protein A9Q99_18990 [Gammaproteobacteria bacterium 45_16_T64]|nr:hypothetical protein A9Q99_18990 [Gammaproteobacteria bacterium 45_16_T64]
MASTRNPAFVHNVEYDGEYSHEKFLTKVVAIAPFLQGPRGLKMLSMSLQLYYLVRSSDTPVWVKAIVVGALGYFVFTPDAIPDVAPVIGFVDDLGVLAAAFAAVTAHISPRIKKRVEEMLVSLRIRSQLEIPDTLDDKDYRS